MRFGYVRVSSNYQNEARQVAALKKCVVEEHIIMERVFLESKFLLANYWWSDNRSNS